PFLDAQSIEPAGVDQHTLIDLEGGVDWLVSRVLAGADHPPDRQLVLARELEVATVMRGYAQDRAGAIAGQHVVGDPDRDSLLGEWIDRVGAGKDAGLFVLRGESLDFGFRSGALDICVHGGTLVRRHDLLENVVL